MFHETKAEVKPLEEMGTLMEVDPFPRCPPLEFSSDFDSGNCLDVELIHNAEGSFPEPYFNNQHNDYEVNVKTKPDCYGSKYVNGNRTWFHFGITGGKPNGMMKINILNLNKQNRLFEQGMQPVFRCLPEKPNWERIRDRVVLLGTTPNDCSISFRHKLPETSGTSTLFFAFTYPYSYSDMLVFLDNLDTLNNQDHFLTAPLFPSKTELALTRSANANIQNEIYYHRECVCHSLEGRRMELITISSYFGHSTEREEYLINLFPYKETEVRPYKFPYKKVVFMSARVHPGETCSQFVFNGFLKFILEAKDPRAIILRRLFVFKLIPILNPDGVAHGHYRTDTRGVNLNRVYLKPSPIIHPTIYAARKLLLYAHYGHDTQDDYEYATADDIVPLPQSSCSATPPAGEPSETDPLVEKPFGPVEVKPEIQKAPTGDENMVIDENVNSQPSEQAVAGNSQSQCTLDSCDEDSADVMTADVQDPAFSCEPSGASSASCMKKVTPSSSKTKLPKIMEKDRSRKTIRLKKSSKSETRTSAKDSSSNEKLGVKSNKKSKSKTERKSKSSLHIHVRSSTKLRSSISYQSSLESQSGIFMYVDLHGHATKRGIFMYGNHFTDAEVQAECMLFPRLMAMNCQDFDFAACNFTERLMGLKDRRDGASREGSGRVAVLKLTGLIRSYTLECNYNTGRIVNHLPSRPMSFGFSETMPHSTVHPPKFTPAIFETAGQAIAESILDLTGHNPWSRISYTEFRNLDGMRKCLHRRLLNTVEFRVKDPPPMSLRKSLSFSGMTAPLLSQSSVAFGPKKFPPNRKRSISNIKQTPFSSTAGTLVLKKENSGSIQNKSSSSKLKAHRPSHLYEKSTFNAPTASSKAKLVGPAKAPVPVIISKKLDPINPSVPSQSRSLSKIFKTKKKVQKKISKKSSDMKPSSA